MDYGLEMNILICCRSMKSLADIWLHWVHWVSWTDSGEEENEPNIAGKSQYFVGLTWNSSAYGHVCGYKVVTVVILEGTQRAYYKQLFTRYVNLVQE